MVTSVSVSGTSCGRWYLGKRVVSSLVPSREHRQCDVFVFVFMVVVVVVVDAAHNEAPANVTVVLSHRHADCQREYCRTVIGLFEETRADRRIGADLERGREEGKKHYLASIRNVRLTIPARRPAILSSIFFLLGGQRLYSSLSLFGANRTISTRFCEINNTGKIFISACYYEQMDVSACLSNAPCMLMAFERWLLF